MKTIIFGNDIRSLKQVFPFQPGETVHVVQMVYDRRSREILETFHHANVKLEFVEESKYVQNFERIYAEFIGQLNIRNSSLSWWALDLTNKNPITTGLCTSVYYSILLHKVMEFEPFTTLLVISDDTDVLDQLSRHLRGRSDVRLIRAGMHRNVKRAVLNVLPLAVLYKAGAAVINKWLAKFYLPALKNTDQTLTFVMSLLYAPSFKNDAYQDVYFGGFVEHLKKKQIPFINLMEVCAPYREMMQKTRRMADGSQVYSKEYFVSWRGWAVSFVRAFARFFVHRQFKQCPAVEGVDVTWLVNRYIRYEYSSTRYFSNLLMYYSLADVGRKLVINKFYYPFENRSFEKMIILALRNATPRTKIVGYQHASLSLRHTNFLLGKDEHKVTPLPDMIITLGEVTAEIMSKDGNFPESLLQVGCALRQEPYAGELKKRRPVVQNVFVALATGIEEYVKVLQFLDRAWGQDCPFTVWIRPHPVFSLEEAVKIAGQPSFKFHKADKESLEECYAWADVVLYVHSTLSIEGMMRGLPAVHVHISSPLNPDPLFNFQDFKWQVNDPKTLTPVIRSLSQLSGEEFERRQKQGRDFALKYIRGTTEPRMEEFYYGQG